MNVLDGLDEVALAEDEINVVRLFDLDGGELHDASLLRPMTIGVKWSPRGTGPRYLPHAPWGAILS
jgi:hypothetical protein